MADEFLLAPGEPSTVPLLAVPKARQLADYLKAGHNPWVRLVEVKWAGGTDESNTVVFDVDVELSQTTVHDIHPVERISVSFTATDSNWPEVLALRSDFPYVPHLNLRDTEFPRSLCLYEDNYVEQKLRWTAISVVTRVREWLRDTATGTLHGQDQPLEPIFLGTRAVLVLPSDTFSGDLGSPERLEIEFHDHGERGQVFLAASVASGVANPKARFVATALMCPPIVHGVIRSLPRTLLDLHQFAMHAGFDLLQGLRERVAAWQREPGVLNSHLVLVLAFPKLRSSATVVEACDTWAFVTNETVGVIGEALGLWQLQGNVPGFLIGGRPDEERAASISMMALNPMYALSRAGAAAANGIERDNRRITAVGMGALGSQLTATLIRAGYGRWTVVDGDVMLPHNAARHELDHTAVGWPKAMAMKAIADRLLAEPSIEGAVFADVLAPGDQATALANSFQQADAIADFSASLAVARHVCWDIQSPARRLSVFLNPTGTALVVLAEDAGRKIPLDCLEMQYYREVLTRPELAGHFARQDGRVRYARSCRDISSVMPEDQVAFHAAVGARAVRTLLAKDEASIGIWSSASDLSARAVHILPAPAVVLKTGEWTLITDESFAAKLQQIRSTKLPNETGGVLLGAWDLTRRVVYVVDTITAPTDSEERVALFIRGSAGLRDRVKEVWERTGGMLQYIGEWHSHPDGYGTVPSDDDCNVFSWLSEKTHEDGFPPIMLIVGERGMRWFIGSIERPRVKAPRRKVHV
ncbi:MAG: ThiF family protein [Candidatus Sulfotelmatobacter sp.]|nr:ThiF family protein [Candidatus Sulfotelmatobacter sp.]